MVLVPGFIAVIVFLVVVLIAFVHHHELGQFGELFSREHAIVVFVKHSHEHSGHGVKVRHVVFHGFNAVKHRGELSQIQRTVVVGVGEAEHVFDHGVFKRHLDLFHFMVVLILVVVVVVISGGVPVGGAVAAFVAG